MSTGEIARLALQRGFIRCQGKTPEATMASALYTDVKKKGSSSVFTRPEEGLFGLREWRTDGPVKTPGTDSSRASPACKSEDSGRAEPPHGAASPKKAQAADENLLLLLNAADELESAVPGSASKPPARKRRKSETAETPEKVPEAKVLCSRSTPISRPRPIQFPLQFAGAAQPPPSAGKMGTPAPPTPAGPLERVNSPSNDSHASSRHNAKAQAQCPSAGPRSVQDDGNTGGGSRLEEDVYSDTSTSTEDESVDGAVEDATHASANALRACQGGMPALQLPQVGSMLAAGSPAGRLYHADALIAQLEAIFGRWHPLVRKAPGRHPPPLPRALPSRRGTRARLPRRSGRPTSPRPTPASSRARLSASSRRSSPSCERGRCSAPPP